MSKRITPRAASMPFNRRRVASIKQAYRDAKKKQQDDADWAFLEAHMESERYYYEEVFPALVRCLEAEPSGLPRLSDDPGPVKLAPYPLRVAKCLKRLALFWRH